MESQLSCSRAFFFARCCARLRLSSRNSVLRHTRLFGRQRKPGHQREGESKRPSGRKRKINGAEKEPFLLPAGWFFFLSAIETTVLSPYQHTMKTTTTTTTTTTFVHENPDALNARLSPHVSLTQPNSFFQFPFVCVCVCICKLIIGHFAAQLIVLLQPGWVCVCLCVDRGKKQKKTITTRL